MCRAHGPMVPSTTQKQQGGMKRKNKNTAGGAWATVRVARSWAHTGFGVQLELQVSRAFKPKKNGRWGSPFATNPEEVAAMIPVSTSFFFFFGCWRLEAQAMWKALAACGLERLRPTLRWPGVGTRWRRFLRWAQAGGSLGSSELRVPGGGASFQTHPKGSLEKDRPI